MPSWLTSGLGALAVFALTWLSSWNTTRRMRNKRKELDFLVASSLPKLDCMIGDKHYLGAECKMVKTFLCAGGVVKGRFMSRLIYPSAVQLCCTQRGSWFLFNPATSEVTPCNENAARIHLSDDYELYSRTFGEPDVA